MVNNVLPAAFANQDASHVDTGEDWIDIACVGAPVPHKNFDILPDVIQDMKKRGIKNGTFIKINSNGLGGAFTDFYLFNLNGWRCVEQMGFLQ